MRMTVHELQARLHDPNIKILDATWSLPQSQPDLTEGYIPGAQRFDIDVCADQDAPTAHMAPNADTFTQYMDKLSIDHTNHVVCYDRHGVFSAPRAWWTFRRFGHKYVYILDGGLPAWIRAGFKTSTDMHSIPHPTPRSTPHHADAVAPQTYQMSTPLIGNVMTMDEILNSLQTDQPMNILDARPRKRFMGEAPEPRAGLRSGHIPCSRSFPLSDVLTPQGTLKSISVIKRMIDGFGLDPYMPIITTCGSGITAAGLAFILDELGFETIRLYDGSWAEWGASTAPISPH